MEHFTFNYNVAIDTINCINDIDFTYHMIRSDYLTLHTHDDYYEFTIVLDGEIINIRNGQKEIITKNTLFICNSNDSHFIKKSSSEIKIINIIARNRGIYELINALYPNSLLDYINNNKVITLSDDIVHLINKNIDAVNAISSKDWKLTNSLLKTTISIILNFLFLKSFEHSVNESNQHNKFLRKLNDLKSSSNFFKYSVDDLCYEFNFSRTHLNRLFNDLFNESPFTYLIKCKMEYAASLLLHTDYSVKEISALVGYTSTIRFSHNFKQFYNQSPIKYRGRS